MPKDSVVIAETGIVSETDLKPLFAEEVAASSILTRNLRTEFLAVSADKVRLRLREFIDKHRARRSWQTPAGILVSLVAALLASDFNDLLLPSDAWLGIFWLFTVGCSLWLMVTIVELIRYRDVDIEKFIDMLRSEETVHMVDYSSITNRDLTGESDSDSPKPL